MRTAHCVSWNIHAYARACFDSRIWGH